MVSQFWSNAGLQLDCPVSIGIEDILCSLPADPTTWFAFDILEKHLTMFLRVTFHKNYGEIIAVFCQNLLESQRKQCKLTIIIQQDLFEACFRRIYIQVPCGWIISHIAQLPPQNILRKSTSSCTGFLQAASRMQNDIIRSSSGTKNVRFTAT